MRFSDIPGHGAIKARLAASADRGRVSHAFLFTGRSGSATLPLAVAYARYVNCSGRRGGDSCGECPSCRKYSELAHPDLHFVFPVNSVKGGSQKPLSDSFMPAWRKLWKDTGGLFDEQAWYRAIDIENAQGIITRAEAGEIIRKLSFKSFESPYKVVIIWLPERMRSEAANSLLKILEEPWDGTLFLLVSEAPEKLLPTILSRTQEVPVPPLDPAAVAEYLTVRHGTEKNRAAAIAAMSGGSLLEAEKILDGGDNGEEKRYFDLFSSLMRFSYNDRHLELLDWSDEAAALGREEQKAFLRYSLRFLRESYMMHAAVDEAVHLWGEELDFCRKFSPFIGNHNVEKLASETELAISHIARNGNPKIVFAHFALTVSKLITRV